MSWSCFTPRTRKTGRRSGANTPAAKLKQKHYDHERKKKKKRKETGHERKKKKRKETGQDAARTMLENHEPVAGVQVQTTGPSVGILGDMAARPVG
jgi:hypothetical protein